MVSKLICCEDSLVGMFADLVNGLVQRTGSSQTLHQTYNIGSIDGAMERLV
jgi:hypothetical protein